MIFSISASITGIFLISYLFSLRILFKEEERRLEDRTFRVAKMADRVSEA